MTLSEVQTGREISRLLDHPCIGKRFPSNSTKGTILTAAISLSTMKSLSQLIAKHIDPVPITIFAYSNQLLVPGKKTQHLYIQLTASDPGPETPKKQCVTSKLDRRLLEGFQYSWRERVAEGTGRLI